MRCHEQHLPHLGHATGSAGDQRRGAQLVELLHGKLRHPPEPRRKSRPGADAVRKTAGGHDQAPTPTPATSGSGLLYARCVMSPVTTPVHDVSHQRRQIQLGQRLEQHEAIMSRTCRDRPQKRGAQTLRPPSTAGAGRRSAGGRSSFIVDLTSFSLSAAATCFAGGEGLAPKSYRQGVRATSPATNAERPIAPGGRIAGRDQVPFSWKRRAEATAYAEARLRQRPGR